MEFAKRKPTRLKTYDYTTPGAYFVTICTKEKRHILGKVCVGQGLAPAVMHLSSYGKIAADQIVDLHTRFPTITIDKYTIMPNHIHLIVTLSPSGTAGASPCPTLSNVIGAFKSLTTRACKQAGLEHSLFQSSFYDHVIRNEADYRRIWEYIDTNSAKWAEDCYYIKEEL